MRHQKASIIKSLELVNATKETMETEQRCAVDTRFFNVLSDLLWKTRQIKIRRLFISFSSHELLSYIQREGASVESANLNFRKGQFVSPSTSFETLLAVILSFNSNFSSSIANAHKAIYNWHN